jgi:hypothetical protein
LALGLSGSGVIAMKIEGSFPSKKSSMALSLRQHELESNILSAKGMGYRFIVETEVFKGDIRIEPLLKDDSRIYCESTLNTISNVEFEMAEAIFKDMYELSTLKVQEVVEKLFRE